MATHALDLLYGGLSRTERARLIARCVRTDDFRTLEQVRVTCPPGDGDHFNSCMATVRRHTTYAHWIADCLRLQAERDESRLTFVAAARSLQTLARLTAGDVWKLVPYPVTESEYARIVEMDKARPEPLDALACYMWEMGHEDAERHGWRPELVAWLATTEPEDDAGEAEALALIQAAITRGELPTPSVTEDGLCLPWGACTAWLAPGRPAREPYGPDYWIPLVELLGGAFATWEHHPNSEQDAVTARRDLLARTLALVAALDRHDLPGSIHPPESMAAWTAEHARVQAAWPWEGKPWRGLAEHIGAQQATALGQWHAVQAVLEETQATTFCGEDPIPAALRGTLDGVQKAMDRVAAAWSDAGGAFYAEDWPTFEVSEDLAATLLDDTRFVLQAGNGAD